MDSERFRELSWTYLLWGLPEPESRSWEEELARRGAAGQQELARMYEAIASLALTAPPAIPSPALRAALFQRIAAAPGEDRPGALSTAMEEMQERPTAPSPRKAPAADSRKVVPLRAQPRYWALVAGVAAMLILLLGLWNIELRRDMARVEGELARAEEAAKAATSRLAEAENRAGAATSRLAQTDSLMGELEAFRRVVEALVSPSGNAHRLVGTENEPRAVARVFIDPATRRALLFAYELPILPPGRVYELWAIRGGQPVAAGTFTSGNDGRARIELPNARILEGADALAVTVEPAPGRPAPTGKMVLLSS